MEKFAFAKINLSLDVLSKREDGYHNIDTIMVPISLGDEMYFQKIKSGIEISGMENMGDIPKESNYIYRAWERMCQHKKADLGLRVRVNKKIPIAAGLAGGTSNGAQTLHALNELYELDYSLRELQEMALPLGADFPYMLSGKTARARGIGEQLEYLEDFSGIKGLLVNPGYGISTPWVYQRIEISSHHPSLEEVVEAMKEKTTEKLVNRLYNKMEEPVFFAYPQIKEIKESLNQLGGVALMSGSGATVFALFEEEEERQEAYEKMKHLYSCVELFETGEQNGGF